MQIAPSIDNNVIPLIPPTPLRRYSTQRQASKFVRLGVDPQTSLSQTVDFSQARSAEAIDASHSIAYPSEVLLSDRPLSDSEPISLLEIPTSQDETAFGGKLLFQGATQAEEVVSELSLVDPLAGVSPTLVGAKPISPLRDRDIMALAGFFEREDATDIEADVNQMLSCLYPEPCWDDREFDFLGEYV